MIQTGHVRVAVFRKTEIYRDMTGRGQFDIVNPEEPNVVDMANEFLSKNNGRFADTPRFDVKPVEIRDSGKERVYAISLVVLYTPNEVISDVRGPKEAQEEKEKAAPEAVSLGGEIPIKFRDTSELADWLRKVGVDPRTVLGPAGPPPGQ